MGTPLSAAATVAAHLDSLVRLGVLITGAPSTGEEAVRRAVLSALADWPPGEDPVCRLQLAMMRSGLRQARLPIKVPVGADPVWTAVSRLPALQGAALVLGAATDLGDA